MKKSDNKNFMPCEIMPEKLENVTGGTGKSLEQVVCKLKYPAGVYSSVEHSLYVFCTEHCKYNGTPKCDGVYHDPSISDEEIIEAYKPYFYIKG